MLLLEKLSWTLGFGQQNDGVFVTSSLINAVDVLNRGMAKGSVLKLSQPLSFWGGFNPTNGVILDTKHPQAGLSISNTILVMPGSRGSAGTPGGVAEALRRKVGPAAIILPTADVNITIGAQVADYLYDLSTPVVTVSQETLSMLKTGLKISINGSEILLTKS